MKQLLDEVEHDIRNYQNRGLCYLPKPKTEEDNTDIYHAKFTTYCELIECSRPFRFFLVSLMYNNMNSLLLMFAFKLAFKDTCIILKKYGESKRRKEVTHMRRKTITKKTNLLQE